MNNQQQKQPGAGSGGSGEPKFTGLKTKVVKDDSLMAELETAKKTATKKESRRKEILQRCGC